MVLAGPNALAGETVLVQGGSASVTLTVHP
jgi:hypothetical protein